ncbi:hypothetical protein D3C80_1023560 [compost metagenome]
MAPVAQSPEQSVCSAVTVVRRNDAIAGFQKAEDEIHSRHPRRSHDGSCSAFKLGQRIGEQVPCRVRGAGIFVRLSVFEFLEREVAG